MKEGNVTGLTHFLVWRVIFEQPRTVSELCSLFNVSLDRIKSVLRRLERMGFIHRKRSEGRINGIVWAACSMAPGDPINTSTV